jgi:hypothetical protein
MVQRNWPGKFLHSASCSTCWRGKMLVEFEASTRQELEKWLAAEKFHFDWLLRLELEAANDGSLQPV